MVVFFFCDVDGGLWDRVAAGWLDRAAGPALARCSFPPHAASAHASATAKMACFDMGLQERGFGRNIRRATAVGGSHVTPIPDQRPGEARRPTAPLQADLPTGELPHRHAGPVIAFRIIP